MVENSKTTSQSQRNHHKELGGCWGHQLVPKTDNTVRILFHNVNGIGTDATSNIAQHKIGKLKKLVINQKVDIIGIAECNVDWRIQKETLTDQFDGWFSHKKVMN